MKVGRPPRAFEDYDPVTLQALLLHTKALTSELERIEADANDDDVWMAKQEATMGERITKGKRRKLDYDTPMKTGDPVADEWERQIARGEKPDFAVSGNARAQRRRS